VYDLVAGGGKQAVLKGPGLEGSPQVGGLG